MIEINAREWNDDACQKSKTSSRAMVAHSNQKVTCHSKNTISLFLAAPSLYCKLISKGYISCRLSLTF